MTIILEDLEFSNMYSYGESNHITLNENNIVQLTAPNGSGKTSIALIIQELLYSKNIKGIKKGNIINRYIPSTEWKGSISFTDSLDNSKYKVIVNRKNATSKVHLYKNDEDVSEHKVPDTYKKIKDIIKLDFEVFSKLTYQSSIDLLEFLKATDTNRKKFLINLFNLEKYLSYGEIIKIELSGAEKEFSELQGELNGVEGFLRDTIIPEKKDFKEEPKLDQELADRIDALKIEKHNYAELCKRIDKNNLYHKERESINFVIDMPEPPEFSPLQSNKLTELEEKLIEISVELKNDTVALKLLDTSDTCPTCGQPIDNTQALKMESEIRTRLKNNEEKKKFINTEYAQLDEEKEIIMDKIRRYIDNKKEITRFEHLSQLIDNSIPKIYPDIAQIENELAKLNKTLSSQEEDLKEIRQFNSKVLEHNTRADALRDQKREFLARKELLGNDIDEVKNRIRNLNILKKAFSPTGLVAFKLENLTKNLEETINYYLAQLSDGIHQVIFRLSGEKLNIIIIQDGEESPIENVSGGEFGRIQTAILLAIRTVLSEIGGNSVNILFLDEISGTLDEAGKEKLVEVLMEEKDLNVFLISHDFSHPLIEKIPIIKKNKISRIDY